MVFNIDSIIGARCRGVKAPPFRRQRRCDEALDSAPRLGKDGPDPMAQDPGDKKSRGGPSASPSTSPPDSPGPQGRDKTPVTPAIRVLRAARVDFTEHLYKYEEHGGTATSARALGVDEHIVVKTLVMEDEDRRPLLVLMHGDREVSTKNLARQLGRRAIQPCRPEVASKHTGYLVGGTSPFGTRSELPVYVEQSILSLPRIYINGGKRGFLVSLAPAELVRLLKPQPVQVALA